MSHFIEPVANGYWEVLERYAAPPGKLGGSYPIQILGTERAAREFADKLDGVSPARVIEVSVGNFGAQYGTIQWLNLHTGKAHESVTANEYIRRDVKALLSDLRDDNPDYAIVLVDNDGK